MSETALREWTTPTLTEIEYAEELKRLYRCEVVDDPIYFGASIAISNDALSPSVAMH